MFIRTKLVNWLSFRFAVGITLFPFVLIAPHVPLTARLVNHERIHLRQQKELLVFPFYVFYLAEYLVRLYHYRNHYQAYRNISFEREAYAREKDPAYLSRRSFWSWRKYL